MSTPLSCLPARRFGIATLFCVFATVVAFADRTPPLSPSRWDANGPPAMPEQFELVPTSAPDTESPQPGSSPDGSSVNASDVQAVAQTTAGDIPELLSDPGTLTGFRDRVGETLFFWVKGDPTAGSVYGSTLYTDDSTLSVAAVHAGALDPGETGIVKVTILPGQANYDSAKRHGVQSRAWGSWAGSFRVDAVVSGSGSLIASIADSEIRDDPGNVTGFHRPVGATLLFRVTGSIDGFVWGTQPYTFDSDLSTAAVHAGALQIGETGIVRVTIQPVQFGYPGTTRNGVTSRDWLPWDGNYRIDRAEASEGH